MIINSAFIFFPSDYLFSLRCVAEKVSTFLQLTYCHVALPLKPRAEAIVTLREDVHLQPTYSFEPLACSALRTHRSCDTTSISIPSELNDGWGLLLTTVYHYCPFTSIFEKDFITTWQRSNPHDHPLCPSKIQMLLKKR